MTDEEFYDAEIGPALLRLSLLCEARGMGFIAVASYDEHGSTGRTFVAPAGAPALIRWLELLARCGEVGGGVNIDKFLFAIMRSARETGHTSACLKLLGVPTAPAAAKP